MDHEAQPAMIDSQIQSAMLFRLLFRTQDDRNEPELSRYVVEAIKALDDESAKVTVRLWAMSAREKWTVN